jgi:hypothetical protein
MQQSTARRGNAPEALQVYEFVQSCKNICWAKAVAPVLSCSIFLHSQAKPAKHTEEGRPKGAQTLEKQGKKQPATNQKLAVRPGPGPYS